MTAPVPDPAVVLLARVDVLEKTALAAAENAGGDRWFHTGDGYNVHAEPHGNAIAYGAGECGLFAVGTHVAAVDPRAVLSVCLAVRRLVAEFRAAHAVGHGAQAWVGYTNGLTRAVQLLADAAAGLAPEPDTTSGAGEAGEWVPGDPVYRETTGRGHCLNPGCATTWVPDGPAVCPECGGPAGEPAVQNTAQDPAVVARWAGTEPVDPPDPDLDTLTVAELEELDGPAAVVAAALTELIDAVRRTVNAGHGTGTFLDILAANGYRVTPIDPGPPIEELLPQPTD